MSAQHYRDIKWVKGWDPCIYWGNPEIPGVYSLRVLPCLCFFFLGTLPYIYTKILKDFAVALAREE